MVDLRPSRPRALAIHLERYVHVLVQSLRTLKSGWVGADSDPFYLSIGKDYFLNTPYDF